MPRPLVIPVFIPFAGCVHRCVFCNQTTLTGAPGKLPEASEIDAQICEGLAWARPQRFPVEIAFFGGNFLGLPPAHRRQLLEVAQAHVRRGRVQGIRFSTRPDTVTPRTLASICEYPISTVELGVQSMDDRVLACSQRGHNADATRKAVSLLRRIPCRLGLQLMVGLPADTPTRLRATADAVVALAPDFVRIYPVLVFAGSLLATWYAHGDYQPLSLEQAVSLTHALFLRFRQKSINVARMGLQPPRDGFQAAQMQAGPWHPAFGELVYTRVFRELAKDILTHDLKACKHVVLTVHPRNVSALTGQGKTNLTELKSDCNLASLRIETDASLSESLLAAASMADRAHCCRRDFTV